MPTSDDELELIGRERLDDMKMGRCAWAEEWAAFDAYRQADSAAYAEAPHELLRHPNLGRERLRALHIELGRITRAKSLSRDENMGDARLGVVISRDDVEELHRDALASAEQMMRTAGRMKLTDNGFELSTGTRLDDIGHSLFPLDNGRLLFGSDGSVPGWGQKFTDAERVEIAEWAIAAWREWAETGKGRR